jgi:hypothetical protein
MSIASAVRAHLESVIARSDDPARDADQLRSHIPDSIAWITWQEISEIVASAAAAYASTDTSAKRSIQRLADSVVASIARHGPEQP